MDKIPLFHLMKVIEKTTKLLQEAATAAEQHTLAHNPELMNRLESEYDTLIKIEKCVLYQKLGDEELEEVTPSYKPFSSEEFDNRLRDILSLFKILLLVLKKYGETYESDLKSGFEMCSTLTKTLTKRLKSIIKQIHMNVLK